MYAGHGHSGQSLWGDLQWNALLKLGGAAHTLLAPAGGVNRDFILAPGSLYQTHKLLEGLLVV